MGKGRADSGVFLMLEECPEPAFHRGGGKSSLGREEGRGSEVGKGSVV